MALADIDKFLAVGSEPVVPGVGPSQQPAVQSAERAVNNATAAYNGTPGSERAPIAPLGPAKANGLSAIDSFLAQPPQDTRSAMTRGYEAVAKPVTEGLGRVLEGITTPFVGAARMAQGEPASAAFGPETWKSVGQGGVAADTRKQAAEVVVPQTPLQAGIMGGTLAAGPASRAIPALAKFPALARILGGTTGGAAGGAMEDPSLAGAGRGAAWGAGTTGAGEGFGKALQLAARVGPGGKRAIASQDAKAYLDELGRQSPPLAGHSTVEDVRRLAAGGANRLLGDAKEQVVQQIEQIVPKMTAMQIPSLGKTAQVQAPFGQGGTHTKTIPTPMTLREANDALSEIGAKAFGKNPLDWTFNGVDQRQLYGKVAGEIESELRRLNPKAADLFVKTQDEYKSGKAILKPAENEAAYRIGGTTQFNTPYFQKYVQSPKKMAAMGHKTGDADLEALTNVLTRGKGSGVDRLATGEGGMGSAIMQWLRGGNSGFWGFPSALMRSAAPNLGSQYAGKARIPVPTALQQILDMAAQRQTGQIGAQP